MPWHNPRRCAAGTFSRERERSGARACPRYVTLTILEQNAFCSHRAHFYRPGGGEGQRTEQKVRLEHRSNNIFHNATGRENSHFIDSIMNLPLPLYRQGERKFPIFSSASRHFCCHVAVFIYGFSPFPSDNLLFLACIVSLWCQALVLSHLFAFRQLYTFSWNCRANDAAQRQHGEWCAGRVRRSNDASGGCWKCEAFIKH